MSIRWVIIFLLVIGAAAMLRRFRPVLDDAPARAAAVPASDERDAAAVFRSLQPGTAAQSGKPWFDDFGSFVADHPGSWVVGRSHQACLSEAEASAAARADAAGAVLAVAAARLHESPDENWLRRQLSADIARGTLQADALVEHFDRPYGTIWAESVLLDASPARLTPLLEGYVRVWRDQHRKVFVLRAAAAGLAAAAWLMYLFLNAVTRGYFSTRLRLGAAAVTVAAIVLII
jgi:hypothetical protein